MSEDSDGAELCFVWAETMTGASFAADSADAGVGQEGLFCGGVNLNKLVFKLTVHNVGLILQS